MGNFRFLKSVIKLVMLMQFLINIGCSQMEVVDEASPPPPPPPKGLSFGEESPHKLTTRQEAALTEKPKGLSFEEETPHPHYNPFRLPPRASAQQVIPNSFFRKKSNEAILLSDVDNRLHAAMDKCGYTTSTYYPLESGFALVTRIEQINPDGTPLPGDNRWSLETERNCESFFGAFKNYMSALLIGKKPGYFRVIVFMVTSQEFSQSGISVTDEEAKEWFTKGLNVIPRSCKFIPYTNNFSVTALIYEFKITSHTSELVIPSFTGKIHLQRSKLWSALQNKNT